MSNKRDGKVPRISPKETLRLLNGSMGAEVAKALESILTGTFAPVDADEAAKAAALRRAVMTVSEAFARHRQTQYATAEEERRKHALPGSIRHVSGHDRSAIYSPYRR
jgi:phage portal protein BeeE